VAEHPIQGLMKTAMESIKEMVDVNTIVGDPVQTEDGQVIVPVSRVTFGFAAGGGEYGGSPTNGDGNGGNRGGEGRGGADGGGRGGGGGGEGDGGGGEGGHEAGQLPFAGGSGAGVTIQPMGFLVVGQRSVRMLSVDGRAVFDRLIDVAPQMLGELRGFLGGTAAGSGAARDIGPSGEEDGDTGRGEEPPKRRQAREYRA